MYNILHLYVNTVCSFQINRCKLSYQVVFLPVCSNRTSRWIQGGHVFMGNLGCSLSLQWYYLAYQLITLPRNYFLVSPSLVNNFQSTLGGKNLCINALDNTLEEANVLPQFYQPLFSMDFGHRAVKSKYSSVYSYFQWANHIISFNQPVKYNLIPPYPSSGARGCLLVCEDQQVRTWFPGACDKEKSVSLYMLRTPASVLCEWWAACRTWHGATPET